MSIVGKTVEMNWGTICFKGIVISNENDFYYDVNITESNTDRIPVGSIKTVMEDDITGLL